MQCQEKDLQPFTSQSTELSVQDGKEAATGRVARGSSWSGPNKEFDTDVHVVAKD